MADLGRRRASRELFVAAFGAPPFALEDWVVERMTALLEPENVSAGQTIFRRGDPPDWIYLMRQGRVRLTGDREEERLLEGTRVFGLFDVLLDRPLTRSAVALTDNQLMKVRADDWMDLVEDSFALARAAVGRLALQVLRLEERRIASGDARGGGDVARHPNDLSGPAERLIALKEAPLLRRADVQTLSDLALLSEPRAFSRGQALFGRGALDGQAMLLVAGEVESRVAGFEGVSRDGPGDFVAGPAFLTESAGSWSANASTDARALAFRTEDLFDLMEQHFDLVRSVLGALALRYEALTQRLSGREGER